MADTQLSDVIEPEVFADYDAVHSPELTAFAESGVALSNALLNQKANTGGRIYDLPFWNDLDSDIEPNISDDTVNLADPNAVNAAEMVARTAYLNNGWAAKDLVSEIAGSDPMRHIRNRTDKYWTRQWQRRLLASADGILADNVANDAADMNHAIFSEDYDNIGTDANLVSRTAMVAAAFTLGDQFEAVKVIAMHSVVYQRLVDLDDIDFIKDSSGTMLIPTYLGKRVVVDDGMTVRAGATTGFVYTTILFGEGAFGFGNGTPRVPVEIDRTPAAGEGGGLEALWIRKTWLIHPFGFAFTKLALTSESANLAELALAASWDRVVVRKNVPMAFLQTNG